MGKDEAVLLEEKRKLLKYLNMVMIDVKSFLLEDHQRLTCMDNYNGDKISSLLGKMDTKVRYELIKYRTVIVRTDRIESSILKDGYMEKISRITVSNSCKNVVLV